MASSVFIVAMFVAVFFCQSNAAKSDVDTGDCQFEKYHDDHELQSIEKIRPLIGKRFLTKDEQNGWQFTIGICAKLSPEFKTDDDTAALQEELPKVGEKGEPKLHKIGSLRNTHLMTGRDWAYLEYKDGEAYGTHCGQQPKRTIILLTCDESANDDDPKMVHIEEEKNKDEDCYYLFEMKHRALCPKSSDSTLSVGSIFLIVIISIAALYLIVGFIYQRFVLGSKGLEQIPNYEFWKDFGNLQADGCNFICRSKSRSTTGFRGIGDDQLDATEEIRDDNLLPM